MTIFIIIIIIIWLLLLFNFPLYRRPSSLLAPGPIR